MSLRHIAVIDIGKTNAKLALVDLQTLEEVAVVTRPNTVIAGPPWPHFDTEGHWRFLLDALAGFHREHGVDGISVTTHGACAALLDGQGGLAAPILDYEHDGPDGVVAEYDALRPDFAQTGSPRLGMGLNLGAQLHWQFQVDPGLRARTAQIVTYPQYWGYRLTGVAASDVTSLGCHTDLWAPRAGGFSALGETLGIADRLAPPRMSSDPLGPILPGIARETGLHPDTPVVCGIHDSNASLYPHILTQSGAFSVVSTGTWVIVMTMGGADVPLNADRDMLFNVNALGDAIASARFMGGREYEIVRAGHDPEVCDADIAGVLGDDTMLLPAVVPDTGPFQGRMMQWHGAEPAENTGARAVALSFYLALVTATCLRLTGARGGAIVEGPFAGNAAYLAMLTAATGRPVSRSVSATGTSIGAALLFGGASVVVHRPAAVAPSKWQRDMAAYADRWGQRAG